MRHHFSCCQVSFGELARNVWKLLPLTVLACASPSFSPDATAADWAFRRSYYSHDLPPEVQAESPQPELRSALRRPFVGTTPGFAARGGYRINRIQLNSGNSSDMTVIYNGWFQLQP